MPGELMAATPGFCRVCLGSCPEVMKMSKELTVKAAGNQPTTTTYGSTLQENKRLLNTGRKLTNRNGEVNVSVKKGRGNLI